MAVTNNSIDLIWTASTDDVGVTGYNIYTISGQVETLIKTVGVVYATTVTGLSPETSYDFVARAFDAAGNVSPRSNTVTVVTEAGVTYPLDGITEYKAYFGFRRMTTEAQYYCEVRRSAPSVAYTRVLVDSGEGAAMTGASLVEAGGTLADWVSVSASNISTISKLYNQKDPTKYVERYSADTDMPRIYENQAFYTKNGIITMKFDGVSDKLVGTDALGITGGVSKVGMTSVFYRDNETQPTNTSVFCIGDTQTAVAGHLHRMSVDATGYGWRCNGGNCLFENDRMPAPDWYTLSIYNDGTQNYDEWKAYSNKVEGLFLSSANSSTMNVGDNGIVIGCSVTTNTGVPTVHFEGFISEVLVYDGDYAIERGVRDAEIMTAYNIADGDSIAPSTPVLSSAAGDEEIVYNWTAATDTGGSGLKNYEVYRDDGVLLNTTTGLTYTRTGLTNGTQYGAYVVAVDNFLNKSANSNTELATPQAGADTQNPVMGTLSLGTTGGNSQVLNWTAATDNVGVTAYRVYKDGILEATLGNVLTYTVTGLTSYVEYDYTVTAGDAAGNWSAVSNQVTKRTLDNVAPSAPVASFVSKTETTVTISWTIPYDNAGDPPFYLVFKDGGWVTPTLGNVQTYTYTGLSSWTEYDFKVKAKDAAGNQGAFSNIITVTTDDTTAPTAVTITEDSKTETSVTVSRTNSTDAGSGINNYGWFKDDVFVVNTWTNPYTFTGLTAGTEYDFKCRPYDIAGNYGSYSNILTVTTDAPSLASTSITPFASSDQYDACLETVTTQRWTDGDGGSNVPNVGEIIYTDSGGTSVFAGASQWYKHNASGYSIQISNSGVITSRYMC